MIDAGEEILQIKTLTLIDVRGNILAVFNQKQSFKIGKVSFEAHIESDDFLHLQTSFTSDTRNEAHQRIMKNMRNEISARKKDLALITKDIETLTMNIEKCEDDAEELGQEMTRLYMIRGQHKKRIHELQNQSKVSITYQKVCTVRSVLIPKGLFVKVPWFPKPVMWYTEIEEKVEEKISMITEEVVGKVLRESTIGKEHIFVVGGYGSEIKSSGERYDPDQDKWTTIQSMNTPRKDLGMTAIDGKLYVIGGQSKRGYLKSMEQYDAEHNRWKIITSIPLSRCFGAASVGGKIYIVGSKLYASFAGSNTPSCVEEYDPKTNKWTTGPSMLQHRRYAGVAVLDGQLYAVGGLHTSSVERYDTEQQKWTSVAKMNFERAAPGVAALDGYLYAIGGFNDGSISSVEKYDPDKDIWAIVAPMNIPRSYVGAAVAGGQLYAIGGQDNMLNRLNSVERYDPKHNIWIAVASMNSLRCSPGVAVIESSNQKNKETVSQKDGNTHQRRQRIQR